MIILQLLNMEISIEFLGLFLKVGRMVLMINGALHLQRYSNMHKEEDLIIHMQGISMEMDQI